MAICDCEAAYTLIAEIVRVALRDAKRGDTDAIEWLDDVLPQWRQFASAQPAAKPQKPLGLTKRRKVVPKHYEARNNRF